MIYDNVPAGQVVDSADWAVAPNGVIRLKFNNGVTSDTEGDFLTVSYEEDLTYGGNRNYFITLKRSGIYTFNLWVRWFEPDINHFHLGHTLWVGETGQSRWSYPGQFSFPFTALFQETASYDLSGYGSWTQNVHAFNHMTPVSLTTPSNPDRCRVWPAVYHYRPTAGVDMNVILNSRLFVRYEGQLGEGANWDQGYPG